MPTRQLLFTLILVCTGWTQQLFNPTAVDERKHGSLFILDLNTKDYDKVLVLDDKFSRLSLKTSFKLPYGYQHLGISSLEIENQEYLFVSEVFHGQGFIQKYTVPDGRPIQRWHMRQPCSSLAIDDKHLQLFAVSSSSNEIFQLDLNSGQIRAIAEINLAGSLGPIVVDVDNQRLFVADSREGDLYQIDLSAHVTIRKIASALGQPNALVLGDDKLYIYDDSHMRILTFNANSKQLTIFSSRQPKFRAPSGMTLGGNGALWLLDHDARRIFQISSTGIITQQWP